MSPSISVCAGKSLGTQPPKVTLKRHAQVTVSVNCCGLWDSSYAEQPALEPLRVRSAA